MISGGGSGHEPAHAGYVGRGMLSAAVAGDVFTSPSPDAVLAAIRATAGPAGALLIIKNYTGDRLNFGLAAELARAEGIPVETVLVADDVALAASPGHAGRRGLAGTVLVHKIAGAVAESGATLAAVAAAARAAAGAVRTMGLALSSCTVPAAGRPGFTLGETEIELGLGIHGEPGVRRGPLEPADVLVDRLLDAILADLALAPGARVVLLINNLGATPTMELAVVARRAVAVLEGRGVAVERAYFGTFLSALDMAGVSLSVLPVDDERLAHLDAPTDAPAWPNAAARPRRRSAADGSGCTEPSCDLARTDLARRRPSGWPGGGDPGRDTGADRGGPAPDGDGPGGGRRRPRHQPGARQPGRAAGAAGVSARRPRRRAARPGGDAAALPRRHLRPALRRVLPACFRRPRPRCRGRRADLGDGLPGRVRGGRGAGRRGSGRPDHAGRPPARRRRPCRPR